MRSLAIALSFAALTAASPFSSSPLVPRATCSNQVSCSSGTSSNTCCVPTYGLLVLVQQWIPGYGPSDAFTLHGLWPDACDGTFAPSSGCDSSRQYTDVDTRIANYGDQQLVSDLKTYWPSDAGPDNTFHSHEWSKHGTCLSTIAPSCYSPYKQDEDVHDFFKTTLGLRAQYDMYKAFTAAGLKPGSSADASQYIAAIQKAYGVKADVNCASGAIDEIRMYLHTNGPLSFVPTDSQQSSSCSGSVSWPSKGTSPAPSTTSSSPHPTKTPYGSGAAIKGGFVCPEGSQKVNAFGTVYCS